MRSTNGTARRYVSSDVETVWKQTTNRLLDAPAGSFDNQMWSEARMAILWWLNTEESDSVRMPLRILLRLDNEDLASLDSKGEADFFETETLNLVINHWRKLASDSPELFLEEADMRPKMLMDKLQHFHDNSKKLKPNTVSYAMVFDGISALSSQKTDPNEGVFLAERVLDWVIENSSHLPHLRPNVFTFSSVMNAWVKSGRVEAPQKVEQLLEDMKLLHLENPDWEVAPNNITYSTAIDAWAKVGRVDKVEELLREMHEEENLRPNINAFNGYLVALARSRQMDKAESILETMEDLYSSGELEEPPNVFSYSTLLDAFAKANYHGAAEKAESILRQMIDQGVSPNTVSYNTVIDAYVKSRNVERAEALLNEMYEGYLQGNPEIKPTTHTYSIVLSGWSKRKSSHAGTRGEKILSLMKDLAESGEIDPPDIIVYNSVLDCWAKSSATDAVEKAKAFLEKMVADGVSPDEYSYNTVIYAMVRAGNIASAEAMLDTMSAAGVPPDCTTYNTLLAAWNKSGRQDASSRAANIFARMKQDINVQPDLFTYNIMLYSCAKAGNADGAQALFDEMCQEKSSVSPDIVSLNTVISAWSRSRRLDAPEQTEKIVECLHEIGGNLKPNTVTFNSVLGTYVHSRRPDAAQHCERVFNKMIECYNNGNMSTKPDCVTYNLLIHSWALSPLESAPDHAESIFVELKRRFEQDGDNRVKPSAKTYGALINAWSKSGRPNAGVKAEEYLRLSILKAERGEIEEPPRVFEFTSTMAAWANSGQPNAIFKLDELLHLLLKEFRKGNKSARPDAKVFGTFLMLLASTNIRDKAKYADKVVRLMIDHQIRPDEFNLHHLRKCYSKRIHQNATKSLEQST